MHSIALTGERRVMGVSVWLRSGDDAHLGRAALVRGLDRKAVAVAKLEMEIVQVPQGRASVG